MTTHTATDEQRRELLELRSKALTHLMTRAGDAASNAVIPNIYAKPINQVAYRMVNPVRPTEEALLDPDPLKPSTVRPGGFNSWDAAVCLPGQAQKVRHIRNTMPEINVNRTWIKHTHPVIQNFRPRNGHGLQFHGTDPYLINLMEDPDGWLYSEAAHVLTHQRMGLSYLDMHHVEAEFGCGHDLGPYAAAYRQALGEVITSRELGIGLDLSGRIPLKLGQSTFDYGIEVQVTEHSNPPILTASREGKEMLRFDGALAVVCVNVMIEPPPGEFFTGSVSDQPELAWSGRPAVVAMVGWTTPDLLLHAPRVSAKPESSKVPAMHAMHAYDLFPMDLLPAYIASARGALGVDHALNEQSRVHVHQWMGSKEYAEAYMQTPPFPCGQCMAFNGGTDDIPRKPKNWPCTKAKFQADREWRRFRREKLRMMEIVDRNVVATETAMHGSEKAAKGLRRRRRAGYKARVDEMRELRMLEDIRQRQRRGRKLTVAQKRLVMEIRRAKELEERRNEPEQQD